MWKRLPRSVIVPALCIAAVGGCHDLTTPDTPAPAFGAAKAPKAINLQYGDFALHVPANVRHVRGILLALGGPDTRGFAVGTPFGAPPPVEVALQDLGAQLRELAAKRGLAIVGSGRFGPTAYPNGPASDHAIIGALEQAATLTGRPELLEVPILLYGISGGGPEASGFMQRNPGRVAAMFLKVPAAVAPLSGDALRIPTYMVLAELDVS